MGCSNENSKEINGDISEEQRQYLLTYGWNINYKHNEETSTLNYYPERIESLNTAWSDFEPYNGNEVKVTSYILVEKQKNADKKFANIYEVEGKIIGGVGVMENGSVGHFSLDSKRRLIDDEIINK